MASGGMFEPCSGGETCAGAETAKRQTRHVSNANARYIGGSLPEVDGGCRAWKRDSTRFARKQKGRHAQRMPPFSMLLRLKRYFSSVIFLTSEKLPAEIR